MPPACRHRTLGSDKRNPLVARKQRDKLYHQSLQVPGPKLLRQSAGFVAILSLGAGADHQLRS